jgi:hypothetical protein
MISVNLLLLDYGTAFTCAKLVVKTPTVTFSVTVFNTMRLVALKNVPGSEFSNFT